MNLHQHIQRCLSNKYLLHVVSSQQLFDAKNLELFNLFTIKASPRQNIHNSFDNRNELGIPKYKLVSNQSSKRQT